MYTRCPKCSTCFRVTDRHLAIANGKVRCGQCQHVFNAPEHAIDDLPVSQLTKQKPREPIPAPAKPRAVKLEIKKTPITSSKKPSPAKPPMAPTAKEKREKAGKSSQPPQTPQFDPAATVIGTPTKSNTTEVKNNNFDVSSAPSISKDEDDIFDSNFDLNAAINELTQETDDNPQKPTITKTKELIKDKTSTTTEASSSNIFTTDAYDATNASSVDDILSEMEGQLSLDITDPNLHKPIEVYDANDEFDFLKLDDEPIKKEAETKENIDEFDFLENDDDIIKLNNEALLKSEGASKPEINDLNEEIILEHDTSSLNESNEIDEDVLFDQVDLSDFQDSEIEDNIVLDNDISDNNNVAEEGETHFDEIDIPLQLRNDIENLQAPSVRKWHPLVHVSLFMILLILSVSQFAFFRAHDLANLIPSTQPSLEKFCELVACQYTGLRDTKQVQLLSRDVRLHPKEKKALLISAAMINNANFSQPYPDIHIRLSDISGNIIAERVFNSKTYMGKLSNPFLLMKSKTPVHINFEVVDPGKDAINFEFTFL